jgi:hypothetical protein
MLFFENPSFFPIWFNEYKELPFPSVALHNSRNFSTTSGVQPDPDVLIANFLLLQSPKAKPANRAPISSDQKQRIALGPLYFQLDRKYNQICPAIKFATVVLRLQ